MARDKEPLVLTPWVGQTEEDDVLPQYKSPFKTPKRDPKSRRATLTFMVKCFGWFILTSPLSILGCALCMTFIGIPFGLALLSIAAWPIARWNSKRIQDMAAWEERDRPLDEGQPVPWNMN